MMLLLCYYFDEKYAVAAQRSRSLQHYLNSKNISTQVVQAEGSALGWFFNSLWAIVKTKDRVYISCGPFYPLLFISFFCALLKKSLIVDLRDPWSLSIIYGYGDRIHPLWTKKARMALWIEHYAYTHCAEMWVCTNGMYSFYKEQFKDSQRLRMIPNGYESSLLKKIDLENIVGLTYKAEIPTYVCLGKFAEYGLENAHRVLNQIMAGNQNKRFKILLIGCDQQANQQFFANFYPDVNYEIRERLPYSQALQIAASCQWGICIVRNEDYEYGTKIFDYIYLKLKILNIFDRNKDFYQYFKDYLDNPEQIDRARFDRQSIWQKALG